MLEKRHGGTDIAYLAGQDLQVELPTAPVYDDVDFLRRAAAAGATDRLRMLSLSFRAQ